MKKSIEDLGEQRNLTQKEANVATKAVKEAKLQAIQAEKEADAAEKRLQAEQKKIADLHEMIKKLNLQITKTQDEKDCLIKSNVEATNNIRHLKHMVRLAENDKDRFYDNARESIRFKKYAFTNGKDIDDTAY